MGKSVNNKGKRYASKENLSKFAHSTLYTVEKRCTNNGEFVDALDENGNIDVDNPIILKWLGVRVGKGVIKSRSYNGELITKGKKPLKNSNKKQTLVKDELNIEYESKLENLRIKKAQRMRLVLKIAKEKDISLDKNYIQFYIYDTLDELNDTLQRLPEEIFDKIENIFIKDFSVREKRISFVNLLQEKLIEGFNHAKLKISKKLK